MTDLIAIPKIAQWQKLKMLVLDSVSSPITKRVYNMALDEFYVVVPADAAPGFHQGDRERVACSSRSPRPWIVVHHHQDVCNSKACCRGIGQRAAGTRTGSRDRTCEEREVCRHPQRQLIVS